MTNLSLLLCFLLLSPSRVAAFVPYRQRSLLQPKILSGSTSKDDPAIGSLAKAAQWQDTLLTEAAVQDISQEVAERIELPFFCPMPVTIFATSQVVKAIATQVPTELVRQIGDAIEARDAPSMETLSETLAIELNRKIDLPVFDEEQEQVILEKISLAVLNVLASSDTIVVDPKTVVDESIDTVQSLLSGPDGRKRLARILNTKVDFPFMDEAAEEELLISALENCADRLLEILPPGMVDVLKGHGPEGLEKTKAFLVENMKKNVDLIGLSEEQEEWLFGNLVNVLIDVILEDTQSELLLMSPKEQRAELLQRKVVLNRDLEICQRRYEQEKAFFAAQLERVEEKLRNLPADKI